jgi:hypothetical protein
MQRKERFFLKNFGYSENKREKENFGIQARFSELVELLDRLNCQSVITVPASSDTVESEGRQMKQC